MCQPFQTMIKTTFISIFIIHAIQFSEATEGCCGMVSKEGHEKYAEEVQSVCDPIEEVYRAGKCFERNTAESESCGQCRLEKSETKMRSKVQTGSKEGQDWQGWWYVLSISRPKFSV